MKRLGYDIMKKPYSQKAIAQETAAFFNVLNLISKLIAKNLNLDDFKKNASDILLNHLSYDYIRFCASDAAATRQSDDGLTDMMISDKSPAHFNGTVCPFWEKAAKNGETLYVSDAAALLETSKCGCIEKGTAALAVIPVMTCGAFGCALCMGSYENNESKAHALFLETLSSIISFGYDGDAKPGHASWQLDEKKHDSTEPISEDSQFADDFHRKSISAASHEREEAMWLLLNSMADHAVLLDPKGVILATNVSFLECHKKYSENVTGKNIFTILPHDASVFFQDFFKKALKSKKQIRFSDSIGERYYEHTISPVADINGNVKRLVLYSKDTTERYLAQKSMREAYAFFNLHFENSPISVIELDEAFHIKRWSAAAEKTFGWKDEEAIGKNLIEFRFFHEDDLHAVMNEIRKLAETSGRSEVSFRNYNKNNKIVYMEWFFTSLHDENGNLKSILIIGIDVTEKKLAEEALKNSENMLKEAQKIASLGNWEVDLTTGFEKWSSEIYRILGYEKDEIELNHRLFMEHVHPDDASETLFLYGKIDPLTDICEKEFKIRAKDGGIRHIRILKHEEKNEKGDVTRTFGTLQDVSRQKNQEEELKKLWNAVEKSPASIIITDGSGAILYVNPFFSSLTGYTKEDVLGKTPRILKSGKHEKTYYQDMWQDLINGNTWRGEICNRKKNNEFYWEYASISPVLDNNGKIQNFVAVKEDITDRKQYEEKLMTTLSEFEAIFNNSSVGIAQLKDGRYIHRANKRICEMFGYEENDVIGESVKLFHVTAENYIQMGKKFYDDLALGKRVQDEVVLKRRNGEHIWCNISGKAVMPNDLARGVIWIVDDITERKKLEKLRDDVERMMRHDLKSPLNNIIGLPQLLLEEGGLSQKQMDYIRYIEEAGMQMLDMINLSLYLYKMETGSYEYYPDSLDMMSLIRRIAVDQSPLSNIMGVGIRLTVDGAVVKKGHKIIIPGDELLCYSMLGNLVKNAVEASTHGDDVHIDIRMGDFVEIHIRNNQEVPEAIRDTFFDKYTTFGKNNGTGLGTYSAKLIAETQGGGITMKTSKESGTTVTIRMPRVPAVKNFW